MRVVHLFILVAIAWSCSSTQQLSGGFEDDIYYVPGKRSLLSQEVMRKTGEDRQRALDPALLAKEREESNSGKVNPRSEAIGMARYATKQQVENVQTKTGKQIPVDTTARGYWMGGFKGSDRDLEECVRIMNRYPEGFAYFGNGYEIALDLSYSLDWNVYTVNGRYWWFPSSSNVEFYSKLLFGTYPQYIWTEIWNDPCYDRFAFRRHFDNRWGFGLSFGFGGWGWRSHIGWGSYWNGYADPWGWSGYPWYAHHGFGLRRPHDPFWGSHRPGVRPGTSGTITPPATNRPHYATKAYYTNDRNARTYSTSSRTSRSYSRDAKTPRNTYNRNQSNSQGSSYKSGSYSRENRGSSYGRSSSSNKGGGAQSGERVNSGRRK